MSSTRFGTYEVLDQLASGDARAVSLARDTRDPQRQHLVLKRVKDGASAARFLAEAEVAAQLDHPNIVSTRDFGQVDGQAYLTMDYVPGVTLRQVIDAAAKEKRAIPYALSAWIIAEAASALYHVHHLSPGAAGKIVHRDTSPGNIFLSEAGEIKVMDFGLAKLGKLSGKSKIPRFSYVAPEQCSGRPVDQRADIFSLGVILYEATTLKRLFVGKSEIDTISAVLHQPIVPPKNADSGYPEGLDKIVMRCLDRQPPSRFRSADDLRTALQEFVASTGSPVGCADASQLVAELFPLRGKSSAVASEPEEPPQEPKLEGLESLFEDEEGSEDDEFGSKERFPLQKTPVSSPPISSPPVSPPRPVLDDPPVAEHPVDPLLALDDQAAEDDLDLTTPVVELQPLPDPLIDDELPGSPAAIEQNVGSSPVEGPANKTLDAEKKSDRLLLLAIAVVALVLIWLIVWGLS